LVLKNKMKFINTVALSIAVITNLLLALFILFKNWHSIINRVFALLIFGVVGWTLSLLLLLHFPYLILGKLAFVFASVLPASFFHFSIIYPLEFKRKNKTVVFISYISTFLFIILSFTPYLSESVDISKGYITGSMGKAFPFFVLYLFVFITWGLINFIRKFKTTQGVQRTQILYLFIGIILVAIIGLTTNIILPVFQIYNFNFIGPSFSIILTGLITYSIIKHRFLDIRLILRKSFIYVGLAFFVVFAYYFALWLDNTFFGGSYSIGGYLSAVVIAPLFLLGFGYISKWLKHIANKYFFTGLYDYQKVLETFAKRISQTIKLDEAVNVVIDTIQGAMRVDDIAVALSDPSKKNPFLLHTVAGFNKEELKNICSHQTFCAHLQSVKQPIVIDELLSDHEKGIDENLLADAKLLKQLGVALVLPFVVKDTINSICVVGRKITKEAYTKEDIDLLITLSNQASVAIENARLYNNMEDIVDSQTREIRQKNIHLQKLLEMRSKFLDTASHQLGLLGG